MRTRINWFYVSLFFVDSVNKTLVKGPSYSYLFGLLNQRLIEEKGDGRIGFLKLFHFTQSTTTDKVFTVLVTKHWCFKSD